MNRRDALKVLGMGAAAAALPEFAGAQSAPAFPKGAIIRTLLKDYAPEELAGGATLFHEHMQLAPVCRRRPREAAARDVVRQRRPAPTSCVTPISWPPK